MQTDLEQVQRAMDVHVDELVVVIGSNVRSMKRCRMKYRNKLCSYIKTISNQEEDHADAPEEIKSGHK